MGPHSGPYPTQDPNASTQEQYEQAGVILGRIVEGDTVSKIARDLDMCRETVYARLALINRQVPSRDSVRMIQYERNEWLFQKLTDRVITPDDVAHADFVRAVGEARQLGARQAALLKADEAAPEPAAEDDELEDDDWEVAE